MTVTWDDLASVVDLAPAVAPPLPPAAPRKTGTMTVTAARPQAAARPAPPGRRPAGTVQQPAAVTPPPAPRTRRVPLTPMRQQAAKSMRRLAAGSPPGSPAPQHVRDAARMLESGNEEAAQRHLRAAMFSLTPQSLHRNGVHDDEGHIAARQAMHGLHRHLLLVKDIQDVAAKNQQAIRRDSTGDASSSPPAPDAGYGPGALAQKPAARQPPGDQALNAPARTNSGGSDPAVADPVGPQPKGSKQFTSGGRMRTTDLARRAGGTAKHPVAGKMSKAELAQHLAHFHHRPASPGSGQPTAKALLARHAVMHRVMEGSVPGAGPSIPHTHGTVSVPEPAGVSSFARTWDELASVVVELSAKTGALAVTPAPYGKPGGPGLYGVKGNTHSPYYEQIVKALMEKRGMDKGKASAIAWGALRKWQRGGGHVHSEVRAAATGALAGEKVAQARAHAHASTWDELGTVIDLAAAPRRGWDGVALELAAAAAPPPQQGGTLPPRVPAGSSAGGQFGAAQGSPPPAKPAAKAKAAPAKAKAPAAKPKPKPAAKAAPKKLTGVAAQKASLLATAKSKRTQAQALIKKIIAAQAQIKALNAAGAKSTAANAAATASAGQTASTSNVTATSAPAAASSTTAAASPAKATAAAPTAASLTKQVTAWQGQVKTLLGQAATATAQAGKL